MSFLVGTDDLAVPELVAKRGTMTSGKPLDQEERGVLSLVITPVPHPDSTEIPMGSSGTRPELPASYWPQIGGTMEQSPAPGRAALCQLQQVEYHQSCPHSAWKRESIRSMARQGFARGESTWPSGCRLHKERCVSIAPRGTEPRREPLRLAVGAMRFPQNPAPDAERFPPATQSFRRLISLFAGVPSRQHVHAQN